MTSEFEKPMALKMHHNLKIRWKKSLVDHSMIKNYFWWSAWDWNTTLTSPLQLINKPLICPMHQSKKLLSCDLWPDELRLIWLSRSLMLKDLQREKKVANFKFGDHKFSLDPLLLQFWIKVRARSRRNRLHRNLVTIIYQLLFKLALDHLLWKLN